MHIKGRCGGVMSEAKVGHMIHWMCHYYLDLYDLTELLPDVLDETEEVYGSDAQIELMRRIREAVLADWSAETMEETIVALDAEVDAAEEGPKFFEAVKILYRNWKREWDIWHESQESESESSVEGEPSVRQAKK